MKRKPIRRTWTDFVPAQYIDEDASELLLATGDSSLPTVYINNIYQVEIRPFETGVGQCLHLSIKRRDRAPVRDWRDMQRIKNEIAGSEREACELFPAESRLIDTCNQYHLFVLPSGITFPFGWRDRVVADRPFGQSVQRPFENPPPDLEAGNQRLREAEAQLLQRSKETTTDGQPT